MAGKVYSMIIVDRVKAFLDSKISEEQAGFRPGRSCADQMFTIRQLMNHCKSHQVPFHACFIDLAKAYDSVNRSLLWSILDRYGVPAHIIEIIRDLHTGTLACVRVKGQKSEWFEVDGGVRQGCVMAPLLFNIFFDSLIRLLLQEVGLENGIQICYRRKNEFFLPSRRGLGSRPRQGIPILGYADDLALMSHNLSLLNDMIYRFEALTQMFGLTISISKTKQLSGAWAIAEDEDIYDIHMDTFDEHDTFVRHSDPLVVCIRGECLEKVDNFKYLGSIISSDGGIDKEISNRIAKAAAAFHQLAIIWHNKHINIFNKSQFYKSIVLPILLYGAESWTTLSSHLQKLETFHMGCLRTILGLSLRDRVRNVYILQRCKVPSIATTIRLYRLRWFGHVCRMDESRFCQRVMLGECAQGSRPRGGPTKHWDSLIHHDLRQIKEQYTWYNKTMNRKEWNDVLVSYRNATAGLDPLGNSCR